jgi:hypothetical protein
MFDNSRIIYGHGCLAAYGVALIGVFGIFVIFTITNIELVTAQDSTEPTDQESNPANQDNAAGTGSTGPTIGLDEGNSGDDLGGDQSADDSSGDDVETPRATEPLNGDRRTEPPTQPPPGGVGTSTAGEPPNGDRRTESLTQLQPEPQAPGGVGTLSQNAPQNGDNGTPPPTALTQNGGGGIYLSIADGFQIQVPAGWVVEDLDNTDINAQMSERQNGYTFLARICPLDNALVDSAGRYQCEEESTANVNIMRFSDLHQRPEFASLGNGAITTSDFLSYYIQFWQMIADISDVQIWNNIDTATNIINAQTNQAIATMPAKRVEYTYLYSPDGSTMTQSREFTLLVLNGGTGYSVFYEGSASSLTSGLPPFEVGQMFDSFMLLTATPAG